MKPLLNGSWLQYLSGEFERPYMLNLKQFLLEQNNKKRIIFPPGPLVFNALHVTPLEQVKVVVLGQDPYHAQGQAHGLSFSVPEGVKPPPSLLNVFKEIARDMSINNNTGNLTGWAEQGVLLLNSVLTVEESQAASHQGRGWEQFTDRVIQVVNEQRQHVVFMLWGAYAQKKGRQIDQTKHLVLNAPHPSPLSAYRGFLGCGHFSKCNDYLTKTGKTPINWDLNT